MPSLHTYDFSTLYTTLPHNLIKEKLLNLIEWTFIKSYGSLLFGLKRQKSFCFFISSDLSRYTLWSCQNVCDTLSYLLDNIYSYIRFGTKLYRQIVGIPIDTNYLLVADLFYIARKEILWILLTMTIKLMLSRLLIGL